MEDNNKKSFREIMKGTSLFGGVQIFQILINVLRGKIVALYLGPEGMGLSGLYTSSLAIIVTIAGLGINTSSVRYLSSHSDQEDFDKKIFYTKIIFIITAILGVLATLILSPVLSKVSFKNFDYIFSYLILSFYVFFTLINTGYNSIFQAKRQLKVIAFANFLPSLLGLFVTFPLYYFWGRKAIVPGIIVVPLFTFIYYEFKYYKNFTFKEKLDLKEIKSLFYEYSSLGVFLVIGVFVGNLITYLLNFVISHYGSISDVGLYNASISITNQYVGMLFTAMSVDYFPRLSSLIEDKEKFNELVNNQSEIIILIAFPLLAVMIVTAPILIKILLSSDFLTIRNFITLISFGMLFKAFSYPFGYVSLAKNAKHIYFIFEVVICNIQTICLNVVGYLLFGLMGLSFSFIIVYFLYFFEVQLLCKFKFEVQINNRNIKLYLVSIILLAVMCFLSFYKNIFALLISSFLTVLICFFSMYELNKRLDLLSVIRRKLNGRK